MEKIKGIKKGWLPAVGVLSILFYHGCVTRYGAPLYGWMVTALAVMGLVVLPGYFLQKAFIKAQNPLPVTLSLVCGTAVFGVLTVVASWSGWHWIVLLPLLLAVWQAIQWIKKKPTLPLKKYTFPIGAWLVFLVVYALCAADYAHASALQVVTPNQDFYYNVANVESFFIGFPPPQLRFAGMELRYHFLTELLAAGLSMATGISAFDMLGFFLPTWLFLGFLLVMWECGMLLYVGSKRQTQLWMAFVLVFGCAGLHKMLLSGRSPFWNLSIRHLLTNINGMVLASLLMAAVIALYQWSCQKGQTLLKWVLLLVSIVLLAFSKAPIAGVAAIALLCSGVVQSLQQKRWLPLLQGIGIAVVFGVVYVGYFSKNAQGAVELSVLGTLYKSYFSNILAVLQQQHPLLWKCSIPLFIIAQGVLFSPAIVLLYIGGLWRDIKQLPSLSPWRIFANGMAVGGMAAFFLFDHEAMSQMYFGFAGVFFMGLLAAQNFFDFLQWLLSAKRWVMYLSKGALAVVFCVSLLTGVFQYVYLIQSNLPILLHPVEAAQRFPAKTVVTAQEEQAMEWLAEHSSPQDVFITNRIHSGSNLEGFSFIHTALSGRICYLETSKFAASNTGASTEEVAHRLQVIQQVYSGIDAQELENICTKEQIQWVIYVQHGAGEWSCPKGISPAYENEDIKIFKIGN